MLTMNPAQLCLKLEEIFMTIIPTDDVIAKDPELARQVDHVNQIVNSDSVPINTKIITLRTFNEGHMLSGLPADEARYYAAVMRLANEVT